VAQIRVHEELKTGVVVRIRKFSKDRNRRVISASAMLDNASK
jgi:hypothetical protein